MLTPSAPAFLAPVSLEQFYEQYWEQQPLHISRLNQPAVALVDFAAIESLLANQPVYYPGVQLTQSGNVIDVASYADDQNRILPLRLLELYSQGATIVLSQAHILFPALNELCREVLRTLKMRCQTNVYVSPPGNQGFNAHYDTHDVFILQVRGSKTFNFYPSSVELPFPDEQFDASTLMRAPVDESVALSAGDTLYIPRGVVHDAVADEAEPSIHITLGVYPVLMRDMLQEAVQLASTNDIRLRKSVQPISSDKLGRTGSDNTLGDSHDALAVMMKEMASALQQPDFISQLNARFADELSLGALQNCDGLSRRHNLLSGGESRQKACGTITLRHEMIIDHETSTIGVKIRSFGQIVEFAAPVSQLVSLLLSDGHLDLNTLTSDLSNDQIDAMVDRLLRENLVDVSP